MSLNILVIAPELPCPPMYGGRIRRGHILRGLAARHNVTLICPCKPESEAEALEQTGELCQRVLPVTVARLPRRRKSLAERMSRRIFRNSPVLARGWFGFVRDMMVAPWLRGAIADLVRRERFDAVLAEYWYMAGHLAACDNIPLRIVDVHDLEAERWFQAARLLPGAVQKLHSLGMGLFIRRHEETCIPIANRVIAVSPRDARRLCKLVGEERVRVIPTGVDTEAFAFGPSPEPGRIVFTGSLQHAPNIDAVRRLACEILPRVCTQNPEARFTIVGRDPPEWLKQMQGPHLEVTGEVPSIQPFVRRAQVFVAPVRFKGGIRGKLLEPMAMGVPVVTSPAAAEGLGAVPDKHLLTGETTVELIDCTCRLLSDEGLCRSIAESAHEFIKRHFSWEPIHAGLADTIEEWHCELTAERTDR